MSSNLSIENFESNENEEWLHENSQHFFQQMVLRAGLHVDRLELSRSLSQVVKAIEGNDPRLWYPRIIEASKVYDLRVRSVTCSLQQMSEMIESGVPVSVLVHSGPREPSWKTITKKYRNRFEVIDSSTNNTEVYSQKKLLSVLGLTSPIEPAVWLITQSPLIDGATSTSGLPTAERVQQGRVRSWLSKDSKKPTPWQRLLSLMFAERGDLWVVFIFSVVVGVLTLTTPIAMEALVDMVSFGRLMQPVVILSLMVCVLLAFSSTFSALMIYIVEILQRRLYVRIVEDFSYRIPRASQEALDGFHPPELMNRYFDIMNIQKSLPKLLLDGLAIILQTSIGMIVLAFYHPYLLGFDIALLALLAITMFVMGRGAVKSAVYESKAKYRMAAWLQEVARHPTAFRANSGEAFAMEHADFLATDYLGYRQQHFRIVMRQVIFSLVIYVLAITSLLGLGGWLVMEGQLTLGQLVASELIVVVIVGSFAKLGKHMEAMYDLLASIDKIGGVFDLPLREDGRIMRQDRSTTAASLILKDVGLTMDKKAVLSKINLQLKPGESIAVLGPAASGKSALAEIITGNRQASSGFVTLNNVDIREFRHDAIQMEIGYCSGSEIFAGSIEDNVHLNRPNIDAQLVWDALNIVGLAQAIESLPAANRTELKTQGRPLSTQQCLRLMIARAIVNRPGLLVIDGTLDGLNNEAAAELLDMIRAKCACTVVVLTGRVEIASSCETILELPAP